MRDLFKLGYRVEMSAKSPDTAEVSLYGEIIQDMPENWKWSKEDKSAAEFDRLIKQARADGAKKLLLRINSPGGIVSQAVAMRSILADAGFEETNIRIEGLCASAATLIATLPGAKVSIAPGSEYMIHNPWEFAIGSAEDLEREAEHLRQIEQTARSLYAKKCGQTDEQIKEWMDRETWFTAEQSVEYRFCDEVINEDAPRALMVSKRLMAAMKAMYRAVPEDIRADEQDSNGAQGDAPADIDREKETQQMDVKDITLDQLMSENPTLVESIRQQALNDERERVADIDALTLPGYEEEAEQAKANGTSSADFQKMIVRAQKEKGKNYLNARREETAPAQQVAASAAEDKPDSEKAEIDAYAKQMAALAREFTGEGSGDMH